MLPLIGRIADLRGRVPVLVGVAGASSPLGSLVTAAGLRPAQHGGRPVPPGRRRRRAGARRRWRWSPTSTPPSAAASRSAWSSAVQELGSVLGPLYGAVVLAVADWRAIFAINLVVGLVLAAAIRRLGRRGRRPATPPRGRGRPRPGRARPARCVDAGRAGAGASCEPPRPGQPTSPGAGSSSRSPATAAG